MPSSPSGVVQEGTKDLAFLKCTGMGKYYIHFRAECCQSTDYIEKCFNQKLSKIKFPTKT